MPRDADANDPPPDGPASRAPDEGASHAPDESQQPDESARSATDGAEPLVTPAVASPAGPERELERAAEDVDVEDPALLGAALRQELAGDGGAAARRIVIGIGVLVFGCLLTMVLYALRSGPPADEEPTRTRSAQRRDTASSRPARAPIRKAPTRPYKTRRPAASATTPTSSSAAP